MKKIKYLLIITICITSCLSCGKCNDNLPCENIDDNQCDDARGTDIIAQWKLIDILESYDYDSPNYQGIIVTDYSDKNIIYDFRSNNKLVITGTLPEGFYAEGEYAYRYIAPNNCYPEGVTISNLLIDTRRYTCDVDKQEYKMAIIGDKKIGEESIFCEMTFKKLN